VPSGRLCLLSWHDYDSGEAPYKARDAEFLRECLPEDSLFAVKASHWVGTSDGYVTWKVAALSPQAVDAALWEQCWKAVKELIKMGCIFDEGNVEVIEPGGEQVALNKLGQRWGNVGVVTEYTGSLDALRRGVDPLEAAE
jgi:hypothetical protein